MDKRIKEERDQLLEAAKASKDPTVKQALEKLLFTVQLAHDDEFVHWANAGTYSSGCTVTVPRTNNTTTFQLTWNDEQIQVFSMEFMVATFEYGHLYDSRSPMPGVILQKENNLK